MDGETPSLPSAAQGMTATRHPYQMQFGSRKVGIRACRANSETKADDFTIL